MSWLREERAELAVDRLLDAAGEEFAERGLARTRMEHVATRARCARGTLYRYFPTRDDLRRAYVNRETMRIGARIGERVADLADPADILVTGIATALAEVRGSVALMAWFSPEAVGATTALAARSEALRTLAAAFLEDLFRRAQGRGTLRQGLDREGAVEWVVRVVLSLLTVEMRKRTAAKEAALLRTFLIPALFVEPAVPARSTGRVRRRR